MTYDTLGTKPCKCCGGTGIQTNNEGLKVICPCCYGKGTRESEIPRIMWDESRGTSTLNKRKGRFYLHKV